VLHLELRCGSLTGPLDIALPLALLDAAPDPAADAADGDAKTRVEGHLRLAHVTVTTRIGFRASAFDVASMQPGTVLATGHPSHADVEIAVNGRRAFTGILGRHLGHVGVRVLRDAAEESTPSRSSRRISPS
jgi:flagellar motor switch protein FliM